MRKPELAAAIAEETGLSKNKAQEVLNAVTDQISAALARTNPYPCRVSATSTSVNVVPAPAETHRPALPSRFQPAAR